MMGRDPWPGVSVQISRRRWRCVLDPMLCLSQPGAAFVRGLAPHAEVWLGPEFLNILDNWPIYHRKPELLGWPGLHHGAEEEVRDALRLWQRLRDDAGHVGGPLCWVRDALRESCLPAGVEETVVTRWEALAEALDGRLAASSRATGPIIAAVRDAAALGGVLPGGIVLSLCGRGAGSWPPLMCEHLQEWRLPCHQLDADTDLVARERNLLLDVIVEAGLARFLWSGLRIAVVHLAVPGQGRLASLHTSADGHDEPDFLADDEPSPVKGAWDDACAFWYDLADGGIHVRR